LKDNNPNQNKSIKKMEIFVNIFPSGKIEKIDLKINGK